MSSILVIDDDPNNRLLLGTLIEHAGHQVIEASTGRDGLQTATERAPQAVVVDLTLPDMPGVDVIKQLRADPRTAAMKIALYTATRLTPALDELVESYGVDGVIPKPGEPKEILEALERLVAGA